MAALPYALISDVHLHAWSRFASINPHGVNTRLEILLNEISRACETLGKLGGRRVRIAGDLFHVRGEIKPSVLNPVLERFRSLIAAGFEFEAIPGNHDLEGKESDQIGNALGALVDVGMIVHHAAHYDDGDEPHGRCMMFPWRNDPRELLEEMRSMAAGWASAFDAIIHAPVNGVIMGIPDHGLSGEELAGLGFKRVFAGHYHNHKEVVPGVFSIGALTHQTFSDIGTQAGFLIVDDEDVRFHASHAPKFVEITGDTDPDEIPLIADGNYVRMKLQDVTEAEIKEARAELESYGAAGVVINATRSTKAPSRGGVSTARGVSLDASVDGFIKHKGYARGEALSKRCADILNEARESAE